MRRQRVSDKTDAAEGTFQGLIERNSNFRQQAINHNLGRNIRVVKLLGYLGLLRKVGASMIGTVECMAAIRQNFSSSRSMLLMGLPSGPMQAAHFLPGQIRIGGRPVWEFATPTIRRKIERLFADVEHLPLVFNQADSAAEANGQAGGLCTALAEACTTMISATNPGANLMRSQGGVPMGLLERAYNHWNSGAIAGLRDALAAKSSKGVLPPLVGDRFEGYTLESITARSTAEASIQNRDEAVRVLQYYLQDQQQERTWAWVLGQGMSAVREVEEDFGV